MGEQGESRGVKSWDQRSQQVPMMVKEVSRIVQDGASMVKEEIKIGQETKRVVKGGNKELMMCQGGLIGAKGTPRGVK